MNTPETLADFNADSRITESSPAAKAVFFALQSQPHIYAGTVPAEVIAERRRRNKAARKSRRINRKHTR